MVSPAASMATRAILQGHHAVVGAGVGGDAENNCSAAWPDSEWKLRSAAWPDSEWELSSADGGSRRTSQPKLVSCARLNSGQPVPGQRRRIRCDQPSSVCG